MKLQQSWQALYASSGDVIGENVLLCLLHDNPERKAKLGIVSFRSDRFAEMSQLVTESLDTIVTHAGPALLEEDFDYLRVSWIAQGLEPSAVANVLLDSLTQSSPDRSLEPDAQHAWETTVVSVLHSWV
jgi:hypothetical protein